MALKVKPSLVASKVASSTRVLTAAEMALHSVVLALLARNNRWQPSRRLFRVGY